MDPLIQGRDPHRQIAHPRGRASAWSRCNSSSSVFGSSLYFRALVSLFIALWAAPGPHRDLRFWRHVHSGKLCWGFRVSVIVPSLTVLLRRIRDMSGVFPEFGSFLGPKRSNSEQERSPSGQPWWNCEPRALTLYSISIFFFNSYYFFPN